MAFTEAYINETSDLPSRAKVTHENYNNRFNLLKAAVNNATEGVVETKQDLDTVNLAIDDLVAGTVPDNSITDKKLAVGSVFAKHVTEDVFTKVSSLNYTQKVNANLAHMLYTSTDITDASGYHNIVISRAPGAQALTLTTSNLNSVQQELSIINGPTEGAPKEKNITGSSYISNSAILGESDEAYAYIAYRKSLIHAKYNQTINAQTPFDEAKRIEISLKPVEYAFLINTSMQNAVVLSPEYYSNVKIFGVNAGLEVLLYDSGDISKLPETPIVLQPSSSPELHLDYTSYKVYYDLYLVLTRSGYWKGDEPGYTPNYNDQGNHNQYDSVKYGWRVFERTKPHGYYKESKKLLWSNNYSNLPGMSLCEARFTIETKVVTPHFNSGAIQFSEPTKYITIGYTATEPLIISVYDASSVGFIKSTEYTLYGTDLYVHRVTLNTVAQDTVVVFETLDGENLTPEILTGYYIAG